MQPDLWELYEQMLYSRQFEETVERLWKEGLISGEMHLGLGEEAIAAGVNAHLQEGDALALDHRGTPPLLMRGVDPVLILKELLGQQDGLCSGKGGHMHLFSKEYLAASSGIVGASGPAAAGFALAARYLRPGSLSVAYFGEGAVNQGMLMEALNLASAWSLPVLFVCKDNNYSMSTQSGSVTGGDINERARAFGVTTYEVDGSDVEAVWNIAGKAVNGLRNGTRPAFIRARCVHPEGHFLGYLLLRIVRQPWKEFGRVFLPIFKSLLKRKGATLWKRLEGLNLIVGDIFKEARITASQSMDPLIVTRGKLTAKPHRLAELETRVREKIKQIEIAAIAPAES